MTPLLLLSSLLFVSFFPGLLTPVKAYQLPQKEETWYGGSFFDFLRLDDPNEGGIVDLLHQRSPDSRRARMEKENQKQWRRKGGNKPKKHHNREEEEEEGRGRGVEGKTDASRTNDLFDIKNVRKWMKVKNKSKLNMLRMSKKERRRLRRIRQREKLRKTIGLERENKKKQLRENSTSSNESRGRNAQPNIIFIIADDLGFNDVPWHNPDVKSPELLRLARRGILLENHYVLPLCTPSRAALMTGIYPFRHGNQAGSPDPLSPTGLNTSLTLLPERLRNLGYKTHLVGKWHLGYCSWDYTPTKRGFDSFYGFYLGSQTYDSHYRQLNSKKGSRSWEDDNEVIYAEDGHATPQVIPNPLKNPHNLHQSPLTTDIDDEEDSDSEQGNDEENQNKDGGYDFRLNEEPLQNVTGIYSNELFANRVEDLIQQHAAAGDEAPMFLMLSLQSVHGPVQVPLNYRRRHTSTKNLARRTFLGMVSAMDEVIGRLVRQLKKTNMYQNSLIIFTTDNGGNIRAGGNNFPLRGSKGGVFEGGTRGVAFMHSPLLSRTGYKYTGLMHMVDWQDTLLHVAQNGVSSPTRNDDDNDDDSSLRDIEDDEGDIDDEDDPSVLLRDVPQNGGDGVDMWRAIVTNSESPRSMFVYNVRKAPLRGAIRRKNWKLVVGGGGRYDGWVPPSDVSAGANSPFTPSRCCSSWHARTPINNVMLYNLKDDPLETTDVSHLHPRVTAALKARLRAFSISSRHPYSPKDDLRGHPSLHGGFYSPGWCNPIV